MGLGREYLSKDGGTWSPDLPLVKTVVRSSDLSSVKMVSFTCCTEKPCFQSQGNFKDINNKRDIEAMYNIHLKQNYIRVATALTHSFIHEVERKITQHRDSPCCRAAAPPAEVGSEAWTWKQPPCTSD